MKLIDNEKIIQLTRILMIGFLLLLLYDGAIRKWVFLSHEKVIFIIKDILIFISLMLSLVLQYRSKIINYSKIFVISLGMYLVYVLCQIFNPLLPNFWVGLWGAKSHLLYASLLLILPVLTKNISELFDWLKRIFPLIAVPICMVAIFQSFSTPESFVNDLVRGGSYYVSPLGEGYVRSTGTFSYISGLAWFLQSALLLGFHLLIVNKKHSYIFLISLALLILSVPTNGSRSVVMIVLISTVIMLFSYIYTKIIEIKTALKYIFFMLGLSFISFFLLNDIWSGLLQRFLTSHTTPGDSARYYSAFTNAFNFFDISGWFGFGVGSASNAAPFLVQSLEPYAWLPSNIGGIGFEEESGRLVVELGVIGWIISILFRVLICVLTLVLMLKGKNQAIKGVAVFGLPTLLLGFYLGSGIFFPPIGAAFYWFCVSIIMMAWSENRKLSN